MDLFRTLEKDKDNTVSREQFIVGLKKVQVSMILVRQFMAYMAEMITQYEASLISAKGKRERVVPT